MVFRETPFKDSSLQDQKNILGIPKAVCLASPIDRLSAQVIDLLFFTPIVLLALVPLRRSLFFLELLQDDIYFLKTIGLGLGVFAFTLISLQTICLFYFSGTPGKKILRLQVLSLTASDRLSFTQSVMRSFVWTSQWLFLGIPFLSIFFQFHRRPVHDRVADTIIVTKKKKKEKYLINIYEKLFVRVTVGGSFIFILFLGFVFFQFKSWQWQIGHLENKNLCSTVSKIMKTYDDYAIKKETERLPLAMSLYAAGEVDEICLEKEAERVLWNKKSSKELAYLGKSFVHINKSILSNQYLKMVCMVDEKSDHCLFSRIIMDRGDKKWSQVDQGFSNLFQSSSEYIKIWAIKHFESRGKYIEMTHWLSSLGGRPWLSHFIGTKEVKSLWGQGHHENSSLVAKSLMNGWFKKQKIELSSWMCWQKIRKNCEALQGSFCQNTFSEALVSQKNTVGLDLLWMRKQRCEGIDMEIPTDLIPNAPVVELFWKADKFKREGLVERSVRLWRELVKKDDWRSSHHAEAFVNLIQTVSIADLNNLYAQWLARKRGIEWVYIGEKLFSRLMEDKLTVLAEKVVHHLDKNSYNSSALFQKLVKLYMELNQIEKARDILQIMGELNFDPRKRMPSSEKNSWINLRNRLIKRKSKREQL